MSASVLNYSAMKNVIIAVGILSLLIDYSLALQIGAFNTGVYGQTKSSKPEVVAIIAEVFNRVFNNEDIMLIYYISI